MKPTGGPSSGVRTAVARSSACCESSAGPRFPAGLPRVAKGISPPSRASPEKVVRRDRSLAGRVFLILRPWENGSMPVRYDDDPRSGQPRIAAHNVAQFEVEAVPDYPMKTAPARGE